MKEGRQRTAAPRLVTDRRLTGAAARRPTADFPLISRRAPTGVADPRMQMRLSGVAGAGRRGAPLQEREASPAVSLDGEGSAEVRAAEPEQPDSLSTPLTSRWMDQYVDEAAVSRCSPALPHMDMAPKGRGGVAVYRVSGSSQRSPTATSVTLFF